MKVTYTVAALRQQTGVCLSDTTVSLGVEEGRPSESGETQSSWPIAEGKQKNLVLKSRTWKKASRGLSKSVAHSALRTSTGQGIRSVAAINGYSTHLNT